jgi:phosphoribosylformylglycinamidine cyclo-ligase
LPDGCGVEIHKGSWPSVPVFNAMQSIGDVDEDEMYRAFNMGIGMVFIVDSNDVNSVKDALNKLTPIYEIGTVLSGKGVKIG